MFVPACGSQILDNLVLDGNIEEMMGGACSSLASRASKLIPLMSHVKDTTYPCKSLQCYSIWIWC